MRKSFSKLSLDYVEPKDWRTQKEQKELRESKWKNIREKVLKKGDFTCQYCGYKFPKWQIVHHINHRKEDNTIKNLTVMCQMCNVIHHSEFGCVVKKVTDLYKKSDYSQNKIIQITRKLRQEGKTDKQIIKFLGLKGKTKFKQDRKYLKNLFGFVSDKFDDPQKQITSLRIEEKLPSQDSENYWIRVENKKKKYYKEYTERCGKWLIFANVGEELDNIWKEIKSLTEEGKLVDRCKVSTTKENSNALTKNMGVICVYTYNSEDKKDVLRVAKILFQIEGIKRLNYKEDSSTLKGKYASRGDKRISKYSVTKDNYQGVLSQDLSPYYR